MQLAQLKDSLKKYDFGYLNCLLSSLKKFLSKSGKTLFIKSAGKVQVKFLIYQPFLCWNCSYLLCCLNCSIYSRKWGIISCLGSDAQLLSH